MIARGGVVTVSKPADRAALVTDATYFSGELVKRLEAVGADRWAQ